METIIIKGTCQPVKATMDKEDCLLQQMGHSISIDASQALALGTALVENFGLWVDAEYLPKDCWRCWAKDSAGNVEVCKVIGRGSGGHVAIEHSEYLQPTIVGYQPMITPKQ